MHIGDREARDGRRISATRRPTGWSARSRSAKGIPLTQAVKLAVGNELRREDEKLSLWERLKPIRDRIAESPLTGLEADKAFYDELSGDE